MIERRAKPLSVDERLDELAQDTDRILGALRKQDELLNKHEELLGRMAQTLAFVRGFCLEIETVLDEGSVVINGWGSSTPAVSLVKLINHLKREEAWLSGQDYEGTNNDGKNGEGNT
jgi:hypothetical protein